jgi:hypothetical protein
MNQDSTSWVVVLYRRLPAGGLVTEVMEVRDEVTAQRYFDKCVSGHDHVRVLQAQVTRALGSADLPPDSASAR